MPAQPSELTVPDQLITKRALTGPGRPDCRAARLAARAHAVRSIVSPPLPRLHVLDQVHPAVWRDHSDVPGARMLPQCTQRCAMAPGASGGSRGTVHLLVAINVHTLACHDYAVPPFHCSHPDPFGLTPGQVRLRVIMGACQERGRYGETYANCSTAGRRGAARL